MCRIQWENRDRFDFDRDVVDRSVVEDYFLCYAREERISVEMKIDSNNPVMVQEDNRVDDQEVEENRRESNGHEQ